jgi:hypothetical protein
LQVSFLNGTTTLASQDIDTSTQDANTWKDYTFSQSILTGVTANLQLKFQNVGGKVSWLDNVSNVRVRAAGSSNATTTTLARTTGGDSQTYGSTLAYTATVTGTLSSPGGSVEFRDGTTLLATVALTAGTAPEATAVYTPLTTLKVAGSPHSIAAYYLGDVTNDASDSSVSPIAQTIVPKALDYTGISAANKPYDGNPTASLSGSASALMAEDPGTGSTTDGAPYTGDTVGFSTGTLTGTFASALPANGIAVTLTGGVTLEGTDSGNYSVGLPAPLLTANITPNYASWAAAQTPPMTGGPGHVGTDGLSNLLVYALNNLNTDGTNGAPGTLTGKRVTFTKRQAAMDNGDVTYFIETSPNLLPPWTSVVTHNPGNTDGTIFYDLPSGAAGGKIFARLRVVQAP